MLNRIQIPQIVLAELPALLLVMEGRLTNKLLRPAPILDPWVAIRALNTAPNQEPFAALRRS